MTSGPLGNPKREADAKRRARLAERRFAQGVQHCMATPEGRAFVRHLVCVDGMAFAQSYRPSGADTAFNEGRRYVGNALLAHLNKHAQQDWLRAYAEGLAEDAREAALLKQPTPEDDDA